MGNTANFGTVKVLIVDFATLTESTIGEVQYLKIGN